MHNVIVNNFLLNIFYNTSCVALFLCDSECIKDVKGALVNRFTLVSF